MATQILTRDGKKPFSQVILLVLLAIPLGMWVAWLLTGKRQLVIAIVDKTVLTKKGQEHISLDWILNHERFTKSNNELYQKGKDYYGFFPGRNERFELKGLEQFNAAQLMQLSNDADAAYFTDTYGIFKNEWYQQGDEKEHSGIVYGGMSQQDVFLLRQLKARHKLIITEFNCLASPTTPAIRRDFEMVFGIKWTGWTGRYFDSFDTTVNKELPHWLINNYKKRHGGNWPFTRSGIALVHSDDRVVILENETHLENDLPYIYASDEGVQHYGLPGKVKYSFWFDVVKPDLAFNHVIASYALKVNAAGKEELNRYQIPASFPAVTAHINKDYRFFYFSGDFCDNPVELGSSYFKGIQNLGWFMYNTSDPMERKSFFWQLYQPLVTTILNDYYYSPDRPH
ncbi:MAG: hypothetical protein JWQ78_1019 [Sediminibacterium sp.]|nr:hypothetical protein [Sediminibacterium sp.]